MNRVMVDVCLERGLDARCIDALSFLRSLPTGSVAAVTGFHIIEHLPFDYLLALVVESYRVLAEDGSVLFETPNPENVLVGSHTFYHDFTHRNPITPTAISFLLKHHGFEEIDIIRSSPYPDEAKVPGNDPLTERVNGHLCGPQDFAVTGRKRRRAAGAVV
jgi:O-antigen chain-terminating methyltransferase